MKLILLIAFLIASPFWGLYAQDITRTWSFDNGIDSNDGAVHMKLRGSSRIDRDGHGACLLVQSDGKAAAGIIADNVYPELSPSGAFRAEFTFAIDHLPEQNKWFNFFDNQYVNYNHANASYNRGLQLYMTYWISGQRCIPGMSIGRGDGTSVTIEGASIRLEPGTVHTLVYSWDGRRTAEIHLDGKLNRRIVSETKIKMAPAQLPTVIGDRWGSGYNPFPGKLYSVAFTAFAPRELSLTAAVSGRKAFIRNEDAALTLELENEDDGELTEMAVTADFGRGKATCVAVGRMANGDKKTVRIPLETRLTPGYRTVDMVISCRKAGRMVKQTLQYDYGIAPLTGDRMPAVMWGGSLDHKIFMEYGFTHRMGYMYSGFFTRQSKERFSILPDHYQQLDDYLMDGFRAVDSFSLLSLNGYPLVGRDGKPIGSVPRIDPVNPKARELVAAVAEEATQAYGRHPAMEGANLNTEVRDGSKPGFADHNKKLWKDYSGKDIPDFVKGRSAPGWTLDYFFPADRVISEKNPVFAFYKWWWTKGDGWNSINDLIHERYKANYTHDVWTFHDPAVRVPPFWGSGGKVDRLSHWTYGNPDPISIGVVSSEQNAMAKGRPGQKIMNMTQIIVYRSETAPKDSKAEPPKGLKEHPDATYITLPPDMMRIALWTQLSRQAEAFLLFGQNALFTNPDPKGTYQCTNTETREVVKEILRNVIRPFGPVLRRLPERPAEVAILESGASAIFADRATMGWTGWPFRLHLGLLWANLQPQVIYEEEIVRDGLGRIKVLVMPHCDVLTEDAARGIREFQKRGGIVVADDCVAPAIIPDFDISVVKETRGKPLENKKALQDEGMKIRRNLAGLVVPYTETTDPDLVTWVRSDGNADYLFVINDKRCRGDYLGQYGLVADKGMPAVGTVTVNRPCGAVYDLIQRRAVPFTSVGGRTEIPVSFDGAGGKMLLLLPETIGTAALSVPNTVRRGEAMTVTARVSTASGKNLETIHPLKITVTDSTGKTTDDSGYGALVNGQYRQTIVIPLDASAGKWTIEVQELASGKSTSRNVTVK